MVSSRARRSQRWRSSRPEAAKAGVHTRRSPTTSRWVYPSRIWSPRSTLSAAPLRAARASKWNWAAKNDLGQPGAQVEHQAHCSTHERSDMREPAPDIAALIRATTRTLRGLHPAEQVREDDSEGIAPTSAARSSCAVAQKMQHGVAEKIRV